MDSIDSCPRLFSLLYWRGGRNFENSLLCSMGIQMKLALGTDELVRWFMDRQQWVVILLNSILIIKKRKRGFSLMLIKFFLFKLQIYKEVNMVGTL